MTKLDTPWNPADPLERIAHETAKAHAALLDYVEMGPGRSLRKQRAGYQSTAEGAPIQPPTRYLRTLQKWSGRYFWQARLAAWEERQRLLREEQWTARATEQRDWEWDMAVKLKERAEQMLCFPLAEVTRTDKLNEDGIPVAVTIVTPVRWSQRDVVAVAKIVAELARLATGQETERRTLDVKGLDSVVIYVPDNKREDGGGDEGAAGDS